MRPQGYTDSQYTGSLYQYPKIIKCSLKLPTATKYTYILLSCSYNTPNSYISKSEFNTVESEFKSRRI